MNKMEEGSQEDSVNSQEKTKIRKFTDFLYIKPEIVERQIRSGRFFLSVKLTMMLLLLLLLLLLMMMMIMMMMMMMMIIIR